MHDDTALMYTCSLIEFIGRDRLLRRRDVVRGLGREILARICSHADVLHSENIGNVSDAFVELANLPRGDYDNIANARYLIPDYWTVGEVYARLIEDVATNGKSEVDTLIDVYEPWISDAISNYNTDFYYQSREYIRECYLAGMVLE